MPFDEQLAMRARDILQECEGINERRMFGGLAFKLGNHMFGGIVGMDLIVRLGTYVTLDSSFIRPFDFTGRPLKGIFFVSPAALETDDDLRGWLEKAVCFVRTLPDKHHRRGAEARASQRSLLGNRGLT